MAEVVTDTRLDIRLCPANIDEMTDEELNEWLKTNRGIRSQIPTRKTSSRTQTVKVPKEKKKRSSKLTDEVDIEIDD